MYKRQVQALMNELSKKNLLKLDTITATGKTLGENIKDCTVPVSYTHLDVYKRQ